MMKINWKAVEGNPSSSVLAGNKENKQKQKKSPDSFTFTAAL
jgi:hypothetical protein